MRVLQISDIHLLSNKDECLLSVPVYTKFSNTLNFILENKKRLSIDFIIVTGDISHDGSLSSYDLFFDWMERLKLPFSFIPGNHDNKKVLLNLNDRVSCFSDLGSLGGDDWCFLSIEVLWLGLVAFGKQAELLARHGKGELISVSGSMQINQWTGQDGALQIGYQVVADAIISARTVRPGGGNKPAAPTPSHSSSAPAQPVMDHESAHADAARNWEVYQMGADGDAFDQRPPFDDI